MEFLHTVFEGSFMTISQVVVSLLIVGIIWFSYTRHTFPARFAYTVMAVEVILVIVFLSYQTATGHIAEEHAEEAHYAVVGALHGLLSLYAIIHTLVAFIRARRAYQSGINYFAIHKAESVIIVASWFGALLTGMFL